MTFGCDWGLELGIGIGNWGFGLVISSENWVWGLNSNWRFILEIGIGD